MRNGYRVIKLRLWGEAGVAAEVLLRLGFVFLRRAVIKKPKLTPLVSVGGEVEVMLRGLKDPSFALVPGALSFIKH